jgi:hypothetical protein
MLYFTCEYGTIIFHPLEYLNGVSAYWLFIQTIPYTVPLNDRFVYQDVWSVYHNAFRYIRIFMLLLWSCVRDKSQRGMVVYRKKKE